MTPNFGNLCTKSSAKTSFKNTFPKMPPMGLAEGYSPSSQRHPQRLGQPPNARARTKSHLFLKKIALVLGTGFKSLSLQNCLSGEDLAEKSETTTDSCVCISSQQLISITYLLNYMSLTLGSGCLYFGT